MLLYEALTDIMGELQHVMQSMDKPGRWEEMLNKFLPGFVSFIINVVIALLLLFIGKKVIKVLMQILNKSFDKTNMDLSIRKFLDSLVKALLYAMLVMIVADQVGIPTTSFLALLGSAGLAIGLAVQGSLSNFAGGVLILLLKPFRVGDYIIEDTKGNQGTVDAIDLFYTKLHTPDNRIIVIPNGSLANSSLTNVTSQKIRRVDLTVGISYRADIKKAKGLLLGILNSREHILKTQDINVFVDSLGDSAVVLGFRGWVDSENYWTERWAIIETVKEVFDANGIEIPFNQLDVHVNSN